MLNNIANRIFQDGLYKGLYAESTAKRYRWSLPDERKRTDYIFRVMCNNRPLFVDVLVELGWKRRSAETLWTQIRREPQRREALSERVKALLDTKERFSQDKATPLEVHALKRFKPVTTIRNELQRENPQDALPVALMGLDGSFVQEFRNHDFRYFIQIPPARLVSLFADEDTGVLAQALRLAHTIGKNGRKIPPGLNSTVFFAWRYRLEGDDGTHWFNSRATEYFGLSTERKIQNNIRFLMRTELGQFVRNEGGSDEQTDYNLPRNPEVVGFYICLHFFDNSLWEKR